MKKLIPLLLLVVSMPSLAQRQFDIEVIFFKRAVEAEKISESWPDTLAEINMENTGSFSDANFRHKKGVNMLDHSDYQLNRQADALKKHAGFEVLLHTAWRQGDEGKAAAPIFHIQAGKDYSKEYNPDGSMIVVDESTDQATSIDGVKEHSVAKPFYELDGTLQVYVQHYLYAELAMDLKEPTSHEILAQQQSIELDSSETQSDDSVQAGHLAPISPAMDTETFLKSYRINQKRRMRSSETHYLDHPLMGMIIQVRRVESAEPEETAVAAE